MGASKRLAELICQSMAAQAELKTQFSMVRFGNVLGSSGSVVPLFRKQIAQGGPITITHPEVTRYFMTIPEAAQLVIQAGAMGHGGDVFLLDMGQSVKIKDLARQMVFLSGLRVRDGDEDGDIDIVYTGLRPGEKLYEELLIDQENVYKTEHPRILRSFEKSFSLEEVETLLTRITQMSDDNQADLEWVLKKLEQYVDGYKRGEQVVCS
jgi:FlaA1/EpsC-like NDP-sugar epimerase